MCSTEARLQDLIKSKALGWSQVFGLASEKLATQCCEEKGLQTLNITSLLKTYFYSSHKDILFHTLQLETGLITTRQLAVKIIL